MMQQHNDARLYGDWARRDRHVLEHRRGSALRSDSSVRLDWDAATRKWQVTVQVANSARRSSTSLLPAGATTYESLHQCVAQISRYCHVPPELILQLGTEAGIQSRPDDGKGPTRYEVKPKDTATFYRGLVWWQTWPAKSFHLSLFERIGYDRPTYTYPDLEVGDDWEVHLDQFLAAAWSATKIDEPTILSLARDRLKYT